LLPREEEVAEQLAADADARTPARSKPQALRSFIRDSPGKGESRT
jgi:hypothetical protein